MIFFRNADKRYSDEAIELWFFSFDYEWERFFSKEVLRAGRDFYKTGKVICLDLHVEEAIISLKLDDGYEPYCVVELKKGGKISWRASPSDEVLARATVVASLYEIEELLADKVSPYGIDLKVVSRTKDAEDVGKDIRRSDYEKVCRKDLVLKFFVKKDILCFSTHWQFEDRIQKAFGENSVLPQTLNDEEKKSLIKLMNLAKRDGFKFDNEVYVMTDSMKVMQFVRERIDLWEKDFRVDRSPDIEVLSEGEHEIDLQVNFSESEEKFFSAEFMGKVGSKSILSEDIIRIARSGIKIVSGIGFVKLKKSDERFVNTCDRLDCFHKGKFPKYMFFTLFDENAQIGLSKGLADWRDGISKSKISHNEDKYTFLRKYQIEGVSKILNIFSHECNVLLADEMGLGKTVQSLCVIDRYYGGKKSFLIVTPASVIPVWQDECKKFFPEMVCEVLSSSNKFSESKRGRLWIASYTQLRRNKSLLDREDFEIAILDESQFIKNPDSKVTHACISIRANKKIAITGTPIENNLMDLWTIFRWLMPGLMGNRTDFENLMYADEALTLKVRKQISPFIIRRLKRDVASELPEKLFIQQKCPMTDLQKAEYGMLIDKAKSIFRDRNESDSKRRVSIFSLLMRLRQVACDPALLPWIKDSDFSNSGKVLAFIESISTLVASGKKIVLFSQFTGFLNRIRGKCEKDFPHLRILELTGSTRDRKKPVEEFQKSKDATLFLISLRAGGTGITLSKADYVFIADPWWNPAVEEQAIDRVHRLGRKNEVFIYKMISENSIEDRVVSLQNEKRQLFDSVLGNMNLDNKNFENLVSEILDIKV